MFGRFDFGGDILKTISIDVDGVLANFTKAFAAKLAEVGCQTPPDFEPTDWNFGGSGATPEQLDAAWRLVDKTENFWRTLHVYPESVSSLHRWCDSDKAPVDLYYVTSRVPTEGATVKQQTEVWLSRCALPYGGVVVKPRGVTKMEIYKALGIGWSVDDYPKNVRPTLGTGHRGYLLDRPWNQEATDLPRVKSLAEFLKLVQNG